MLALIELARPLSRIGRHPLAVRAGLLGVFDSVDNHLCPDGIHFCVSFPARSRGLLAGSHGLLLIAGVLSVVAKPSGFLGSVKLVRVLPDPNNEADSERNLIAPQPLLPNS